MKRYLLFIALLFALPALATTRYADANLSGNCTGSTYSIASRNCSGSDGTGYKTIAAAGAAASGGDTLYVRAGTYAESLDNAVPNGATNWAGATTIAKYSSETVWVNGEISLSGTRSWVIFTGININATGQNVALYLGSGGGATRPDHIRFQNAEIKNSDWVCSQIGGDYLEIKNTVQHDCALAPTDAPHVIYYSTMNDSLIEGNTLYNVIYSGSHMDWYANFGIHGYCPTSDHGCSRNVLRNNVIHDTANGILIGGGANNKAYNNIIYHILRSNGIEASYAGSGHTGTLLYNNTVFDAPGHCIQVGNGWDSPSGVMIKNNILSGCVASPVWIYGGGGTISFNDFYGNGNANAVGGTTAGWTITGNPTGDPAFTNSTTHDFSLLSTSAARNTGTDLSATLTTDILAVTRPLESVWDIGSYEYGVPSPANPSVVVTGGVIVTATAATVTGTVTDDGGATVTARGTAYGTSLNPTIAGSHTSDGTGTGTFSSSITGLQPCTLYYFRKFSTNSNSTSYGINATRRTVGPCTSGDWTATGGALTYDTSGAASDAEGHTVSITVADHPNRVMLIGVSATGASSAPTYDGVTATLIKEEFRSSISAFMYKIIDPHIGTHDLVGVHSAGTLNVGAVVYYGADTTGTPLGTYCSASDADYASVSCNATSATGEVVVDVVAEQDSTPTAAGSQNRRFYKNTASNSLGMSTLAGAASTTMGWSWSASQYGAMVAIPIKPASSSGWKTPMSVAPYAVKSSGTALAHAASLAAMTEASWWYESGYLYVWVTGGGNPGAVTIQCGSPANLIFGDDNPIFGGSVIR